VVGPGKTAAVVGDGAVGLCGVIAAKRLGAEQIIGLGTPIASRRRRSSAPRQRRRERRARPGPRVHRRAAPRRPRRPDPPGRVFDRTVGLAGVPDGYRAMAGRESTKVTVRP
jgi:threonine dehydrogenase-like Zn-dependent dehydrogenase